MEQGRAQALLIHQHELQPLLGYQVIVNLIAAATTQTGLTVICELDPNAYPKGTVVSDAEMASLNIEKADLHREWNYTLKQSRNSVEVINSG